MRARREQSIGGAGWGSLLAVRTAGRARQVGEKRVRRRFGHVRGQVARGPWQASIPALRFVPGHLQQVQNGASINSFSSQNFLQSYQTMYNRAADSFQKMYTRAHNTFKLPPFLQLLSFNHLNLIIQTLTIQTYIARPSEHTTNKQTNKQATPH
jgi:hypothetical protein